MQTEDRAVQVTPSLHLYMCRASSFSFCYEILGIGLCCEKNAVAVGVLFYALSCLHTVIPTPSFCGFWHCYLYLPFKFWLIGHSILSNHHITTTQDCLAVLGSLEATALRRCGNSNHKVITCMTVT